jgi:hypothetical protein
MAAAEPLPLAKTYRATKSARGQTCAAPRRGTDAGTLETLNHLERPSAVGRRGDSLRAHARVAVSGLLSRLRPPAAFFDAGILRSRRSCPCPYQDTSPPAPDLPAAGMGCGVEVLGRIAGCSTASRLSTTTLATGARTRPGAANEKAQDSKTERRKDPKTASRRRAAQNAMNATR